MKPFSTWRPNRRLLLILGVIAITPTAGILAVRPWISGRIEAGLRDRLLKSGIEATWQSSSWDPWGGQHFTGLRLRQLDGGKLPIAELGQVDLRLPLSQYFGGSDGTTSWRIDNAPLTLHDAERSVSLEHVSLHLESHEDEIEVHSLELSQGGLKVDLTGTLRTASASGLQLDLKPLHAALSTLETTPGTGPFRVAGNFAVDLTGSEPIWKATLKGQGRDLEWNGIRCTHASADGQLASNGSRILYALTTSHGSTRGEVRRGGSKSAAFDFDGTLQDGSGEFDEYHGRYLQGLLTLESLKGSADLWELSKDVPSLTARRPDTINFKSFPLLEVTNLRRQSKGGQSTLTIESIGVVSQAPIEFTVKGRKLEARNLKAKGSYDGSAWILARSSASLLGGSASASTRYRDGVLTRADLTVEGLRVSDLQRLIADKNVSSSGLVNASFKGSINLDRNDWDGTGSLRMTDAPVIQVPLLDQVYELFSALLPGVERSRKGEFNSDFTTHPDGINVTCFEARGGSSLTVSAVGKIDLRNRHVQGRARGKLNGLPGLVTSPLSRLLEMEVSGPYDDIRVKPLGPAKLASNTVNGTVGVAIDTLQETGKITGTILTEGIKLPFQWMMNEEKK